MKQTDTEKAIEILRELAEYAKYKAWDLDTGDKKAQEIVDSFHEGKYGMRDGIWVQIDWAINKLR